MIGRKASGGFALPAPLVGPYKWALSNAGRFDAKQRSLPNFVVAGTQRGGTTSLFIYLLHHDLVFGPRRAKGVHYFDRDFDRSTDWYRAHFPRRSTLAKLEAEHGAAPAVGEGAPYYVFNPVIPQRIYDVMPNCKVVVLLREPLDRAVSHHNHETQRGFETMDMIEAFEREEERLAGEVERMRNDASYVSLPHIHHAYLSRGQYAEQLQRYFTLFGRDQVLVLDSSGLKADPAATVARTFEFLGLPPKHDMEFPIYNARQRDPVSPELRARFGSVFAESNEQLRTMVPNTLSWLEDSKTETGDDSSPETTSQLRSA